MAEESKRTVLAAFAANLSIAIAKLIAGLLTGSGAMLAEAVHSVADTVNQLFLLVGINLSDTEADDDHPHGYGKEAFFWSFLVAIFIFVGGATFSFFEGTRTLVESEFHERSTTELAVAFSVLGMAFLFEGASLAVAIRAIRRRARARGWSYWQYLRQSPDMTTKTVFWEDSAATMGLVIAATGLAAAEVDRSVVWDGLASVGIGTLLTGVALMLGLQARHLLLGAAAPDDTRRVLRSTVLGFDEVERVVRLLTMQLGSHSVLVTGELQVRRGLTTKEIEMLVRRIDSAIAEELPQVRETFWELRSQVVDLS